MNDKISFSGMTLRDYFAGQALISFSGKEYSSDEAISKHAYAIADAMMKAREK